MMVVCTTTVYSTQSSLCSAVKSCNWNKTLLHVLILHSLLLIGMPIPRQSSFLGDSGNRGMAICHSSGIWETKTYSPGFWVWGNSGNFWEIRGISGSILFQEEFEIYFYWKDSFYISGQPGQGQPPPPHLAGLHARMLELGQNSGGGPGAPPSIHAPPPSNGFPTSAMNMNMKPDNNSPSSSSESPVPPSKLITTSAGIPFQPHNLGSYHHSPMKSESDRGAGMFIV